MSDYETRFSGAAKAIGICDQCPLRQTFFLDMAETSEGLIPYEWIEDGRLALASCLRAQEIKAGQEATSEPIAKCPGVESSS